MLSCRISCICANCSEKELASFNDFGFNYGMAFQLIDDILGIVGNEKSLGKPIGSDVRQRKKTYLIIYALEHLDPSSQSELKRILSLSDIQEKDIIQGISLVNQSSAVKKAKDLATSYINKAISSLANLKDSNEKQILIDLANYSIERIF
jgi:geranylgeranyl diphosphate synthase type I